jgi:hypothetical protein
VKRWWSFPELSHVPPEEAKQIRQHCLRQATSDWRVRWLGGFLMIAAYLAANRFRSRLDLDYLTEIPTRGGSAN